MAEFGMKVFVNLVVKNLKQVQQQVEKGLGAAGISGEGGGKGGSGKTVGLLGMILKMLGPLAILLTIKPIMDLVGIFTAFAFIGILQIIKLLGFAWDGIVYLSKVVAEGLSKVWNAITDWLAKTISFLATIPGKIWNFLKEGFQKVVNFLAELPGKIWAFITSLPEMIWNFMKGLPSMIWEAIKTGYSAITNKISSLISWTKQLLKPISEAATGMWNWAKGLIEKVGKYFSELPGKIWALIKSGFEWVKEKTQLVVDKLLALPGLIWEKIKDLGTIIAKAIGSLFPFGAGKTKVDDALITKTGDVITLNPNDNVMAFQGSSPPGGSTVINNFYGVTPQEMINVIKRQFGTDSFNTSRF